MAISLLELSQTFQEMVKMQTKLLNELDEGGGGNRGNEGGSGGGGNDKKKCCSGKASR